MWSRRPLLCFQAVASGELTPSEAAELGKLIEAHVRAIEVPEIQERLARLALERTMKGSISRRRFGAAKGTSRPIRTQLQVKQSARSLESSVELPGVSERRPFAPPIDTPPKAEEPVFVYSPLGGEWTIGVFSEGRWFDRATGGGGAAANALDVPSRPVEGQMKAAIRILTSLGRAVVTVAAFWAA